MKISCIDIGGTYIKSGVLEDGVLTGVEETPTDGGGGARAMLSRVAQLVRQTPGVERVGVSTAGEVDARTGVIRLSDNIPEMCIRDRHTPSDMAVLHLQCRRCVIASNWT